MFPLFVSIIVPNYNHSGYLEQRLDTVFNQTYQNFEVIILDDKSEDNSIEIIEKYKNNSHLSQIVVNDRNSGSPFKQWKKGICLAKGDYIWIAESDDYCELDFLEQLINEIQHHDKVVLAYSNCVKVDERNRIIGQIKERKNHCFCGERFIKKRLARYCAINSASCTVFRREAAMCVSDEYLSFKNAGDYQFWTEIASQGNVVAVRKNLVYWRQSLKSVTGNNLSKGIIAFEDKKIFDEICNKYALTYVEKWLTDVYHSQACAKTNFDNEEIRQKLLERWSCQRCKLMYYLGKFLLWISPRFENYFGILL